MKLQDQSQRPWTFIQVPIDVWVGFSSEHTSKLLSGPGGWWVAGAQDLLREIHFFLWRRTEMYYLVSQKAHKRGRNSKAKSLRFRTWLLADFGRQK